MTIIEQQPTQEVDVQDKRNRRAFIILLVLAAITGGASLLILAMALLNDERFIEAVAGVAVGVVMFGAAYLAKKGKTVVAMAITAVTIYALDLYLVSIYASVGLPLTVSFIAILAIISSQILPAGKMARGIALITITGILIILADLYWPFTRNVLGTTDTTIVYLGALLTMTFALVMAVIQFPNFTLQGKLISASVMLITLVVMLTTVISNSIVRQSLTYRLGEQLTLLGQSDAATASQLLIQQVRVLETLGLDSTLRGLIRNQNVEYGDEADALAVINDIESRWESDPTLVAPILRNASSRTLATFQYLFPDYLGVMVTDKYGALAGTTYIPDQYAYADTEWWQAAYNDGSGDIYIGQPEYDRELEAMVIPIALPIYTADTNSVVGVLYTSFALESLLALMHDLGDTGRVIFIFDDRIATFNEGFNRHVLRPTAVGMDLEQLRANPGELLIAEVNDVQRILVLAEMQTDGELPAIDDLNWAVTVQQEYVEAFAAVEVLERASVVLGIIAVVVGSGVAAYAAGWITRPINHLTETAVAIAEGDVERHAVVETKDEIGTLAIAFNSMTDQLRDFISSLEDRVTSRTQALTTSSEVSRTLSTIVSVEELVEEVVRQMSDAFGYYHAQLFLLDNDGEYLELRGGSGEVGQRMLAAGHQLPMGQGIVGRAALDNETISINDVTQDDIWLYNADLPDTKGEIAVPIAIGGQVLGILDIQHNVVNVFDDETVGLLQAIATQTALALQNARTFERVEQQQVVLADTLAASEQQSRNLSLLNELSASLTVANNLEDVYRIAGTHVMELMKADRVAILLLSDLGTELEVVSTSGMTETVAVGKSLPVTATVAGTAVTENRMIRLPDERPLSDFADSGRWESNNIKSVITAPLSMGVTAFGVLNIGSTQKDAFRSIDVGFILQISSLLAVTIESQRLAEQARLLAGIVENHPDFIGVGTLDGNALYINPSGLQMMGLPADHDISGINSSSLYAPEEAAKLMQVGLPIAIEQGSWSTEAMLQVRGGTLTPVEETVGINYDADGNVAGFSITMRDITERNAAATALRNSEQSARDFQAKLTLLHEISTDLSGLDTLELMYEQAVAVGREKLQFDRIRLWLIDEDRDLMMGTFGMGQDGNVYDAHHFQIPFTDSWAASIVKIRQGRQVSPALDLRHEGDIVGHGWQIAAVLLDGEQPIGWLAVDNLFSQKPMRVYEPELTSLFANTLANVIVSKRTANTFAKQARELQLVTEISRSAAGLMNRGEMLQFVADAMREKFTLYHVQIFMLHEQTRMLRLTAVSDPQNHPSTDDMPTISVDEQTCIISHAAHQRKALFANDVQLEPSYIAMPDLPDTRAILAVPLILGRELLGVINLHSDELNHFSDIDINVQLTLASQIAAALRNVAQYQEAQEALADLTQLQQIVSRKNWEAFMTNQSRTVQGYLYDQHTVQAVEQGDDEVFAEGKTAVSPLTVQGITIGGLSARNPSGEPLSDDQQLLLESAARQVAEALERARLLEVTELGRQNLDLRASELALLNEISEIVSAQLDLDSLFSTAGQRIQSALAATSIFFALYDPADERIDFPYYHSDEEGDLDVPSRHADADGGFTERVILTRKPFIFNSEGRSADEYTAQGGRLGDDRATSLNSFLGVPMIVGDDLVGAIGIGSNHGEGQRIYNEDDQRLLGTLAGTVGVAVQNVRQFEATQQRARREQTMREISSQVNTAVDPESILRIAAQEIGRALGWQTYVYLTEPDEADALASVENGQSEN